MDPDSRALRDALEQAQQDNKHLRARVAELEAYDSTVLQAFIRALQAQVTELQARLEQADKVRTSWDERTQQLRRELEIAHAEQARLRSLLENERLARASR